MSASPTRSPDFAQAAIAAHPGLNIVVNNAGVALLGQFNEIDQAQMDWLMNINFWGVVHSTRAFLPHLARQRAGPHRQPVLDLRHHRAAGPDRVCGGEIRGARLLGKPAARTCRWRRARSGSSVVHPGGVATNIARNSRTGTGVTDNARRAQSIERFDEVAKTTPQAAALRIIEGIEKNQPRILIGNDARFMDLLQRLRPGDLLGGAGDAGSRRRRRRGSRRLVRLVQAYQVTSPRLRGEVARRSAATSGG